MEKIKNSFRTSFKKGFFTGLCDVALRLVAIFIWVITVVLLCRFVWEAFFLPSAAQQRAWWLTYSMMMFLMVTVLAYTAVWDRE